MKLPLIALATLLLGAAGARAVDPAQADAQLKKLLDAQAARNYDAFVADGSDPFKAALTKTQFDAACDILAKRFGRGYDVKQLGSLAKRGGQVFLFKFECKDGGDDLLGLLSLKDGKVAGIVFQ